MNNQMTEIHAISFRGRFAFAMRCFENSLDFSFENYPVILRKAVTKAWEYTLTRQWDNWLLESDNIKPEYVLSGKPSFLHQLTFMSFDEVLELKEVYLSLPEISVELLNDALWLGYDTIYADFARADYDSAKHLDEIIQKALLAGIETPNLSSFMLSSIKENNGTGTTQLRDFWLLLK